MTIAYIGLGSNLMHNSNAPEQNIMSAIQFLSEIQSSRMLNVSSLYKSKPVGPQDQDDYINAVVELDTDLSAFELLENLQAIEDKHGRVRTGEHWGARTLDLDLLIYGSDRIDNERLTVPHVEMINRAFVLVPLADINPECVIPGAGPIKNYLDDMGQIDLELLK